MRWMLWRLIHGGILVALTTGLSGIASADTSVEVLIGPTEPDPPAGVSPGVLNTPFAMEFDSDDRLWIVEYEGGRVLRTTSDPPQHLEVIAGPDSPTAPDAVGYVDGPANSARFNQLHNLAIADDGTIYLSDHQNHAVRRLHQSDDGAWMVDSFAGNGQPGRAVQWTRREQAAFNQPICVTLDDARGRLLVADIRNRVVRAIGLNQDDVTIIAGNGDKGVPADGAATMSAPLADPRAAVADEAGSVWVLERGGHCLRRVNPDGTIETIAGSGRKGHDDGPALTATMNGPKHLDLAADGRVFIADDQNDAIRVYDPATKSLTTVDLGAYQLDRPHGVLVHDGMLYIADSFHHRILRLPLPTR